MSKLPNYTPLLLIMTLFACNSLPDDGNNNKNIEGKITKKEQMYKHLRDIGDYNSSIYVLHQILQLDSTKTEYYDSLAFHYARVENYEACETMADKGLKISEDNERLMQLSATLDVNSGRFDDAIQKLEKLFKKTNDYQHKFDILSVKYQQGSVMEIQVMTDELLANPAIDTTFVDQPGANRVQLVPMRAAILYLKSVVAAQYNNDAATANALIDQCLSIKPDYDAAIQLKNGLRQMKK
jgi:tetratricopeptide (TPR) repeat protein